MIGCVSEVDNCVMKGEEDCYWYVCYYYGFFVVFGIGNFD